MRCKLAYALAPVLALVLAGDTVEGDGWLEYQPTSKPQQCAGGLIQIDTFFLPRTPNGQTSGAGCSNGYLRAERWYNNNYLVGMHQFGGSFRINTMSGTRITIQQTVNGRKGTYFSMGVEAGGRLYNVETDETLADVAVPNGTVRVNTVHDTKNRLFRVYVNGRQKFRDENLPEGVFYNKIGAYAAAGGPGDMSITWLDARFWRKADQK